MFNLSQTSQRTPKCTNNKVPKVQTVLNECKQKQSICFRRCEVVVLSHLQYTHPTDFCLMNGGNKTQMNTACQSDLAVKCTQTQGGYFSEIRQKYDDVENVTQLFQASNTAEKIDLMWEIGLSDGI